MKNKREEILYLISDSIKKSIKAGIFENLDFREEDVVVEVPREKNNGDFSTNIAMKIAKKVRMAPRDCAKIIIDNMDLKEAKIAKVECAGVGFINFYLELDWLYDVLKVIQKEQGDYGKSDIGKGKKVMIEFVSANPTGPLHMGNARGGALGDLIAGVFDLTGHQVTREFYINDA